jgi:hypothetical protein
MKYELVLPAADAMDGAWWGRGAEPGAEEAGIEGVEEVSGCSLEASVRWAERVTAGESRGEGKALLAWASMAAGRAEASTKGTAGGHGAEGALGRGRAGRWLGDATPWRRGGAMGGREPSSLRAGEEGSTEETAGRREKGSGG